MKTKEYYKIGEISKLYGIGTDALRYYEKLGILKPKRDLNGYRMYNIGDISTLNILRDLRSIGFSLQEIKEHLADFNLSKTLALFEKEINYIDYKTQELQALKKQLLERVKEIEDHKTEINSKLPIIKKMEERKILKLSENVYRDEDLDFIIKKLQKEHEQQIYIIGNGKIGATMPLQNILEGKYGKFTSVFFVTHQASYDQTIKQGRYLSLVVKGSYKQMPLAWENFFNFMEKEGLKAAGDPMELYIIDNHASDDEEEFVTELQVLLK